MKKSQFFGKFFNQNRSNLEKFQLLVLFFMTIIYVIFLKVFKCGTVCGQKEACNVHRQTDRQTELTNQLTLLCGVLLLVLHLLRVRALCAGQQPSYSYCTKWGRKFKYYHPREVRSVWCVRAPTTHTVCNTIHPFIQLAAKFRTEVCQKDRHLFDYCRIRTYARISQWISSPPP